MSDVSLLSAAPLVWRDLTVATPDLDDELLFQAEHEAWAVNRLEATKGKVATDTYLARANRLEELLAGNRFAFGSSLSLQFLSSTAGTIEYVYLLALKGATQARKQQPSRDALRKLARDDAAGWNDLMGKIFGRDFPNQMAPVSSSGAGETPTTSTTASS